jgi:hypothetical protein
MTDTPRFDRNIAPLYGCIAGIELPGGEFLLADGLSLSPIYAYMFSSPMMAFAPAEPGKTHPAPWSAISGGFQFESKVQLAIDSNGVLDGTTPSVTAWLVAALLRLRVEAPVRVPALCNVPFGELQKRNEVFLAAAFEAAPNQFGLFRRPLHKLTEEDLSFLRDVLPKLNRLYHTDRFLRAFTIYDESTWSPNVELSMVLLWTSIETLFDLGSAQHKTKAISQALSSYVTTSQSERDQAYAVIRDLYFKRSQVVHTAGKVTDADFIESRALARAAFSKVIVEGKLPAGPTVH